MPGDGADWLAAGLAGAGDSQYVVIGSGRAAAVPAVGLGGAQPVEGALADQIVFLLGSHRGGHEQHLAGDGGTVRADRATSPVPSAVSSPARRPVQDSSRPIARSRASGRRPAARR
ncbi:MAG: hypothetical protein ABSB01_26150 [Streptosporangiaceae bacterium]